MPIDPLEPSRPDHDVLDYAPFSMPFCNNGGPMLVIPSSLVSSWSGASNLGERDDYERACAVKEFPDLLQVGPGRALVLSTWEVDVGIVCWLRLDGQPGPLLTIDVDPRYRTDAGLVSDELRQAPELGWELAIPEFPVASGELVLMHAVDDGPSVELPDGPWHIAGMGNYLPMSVVPGTYAVDRRRLSVEDILILRLRPL